MNDFDKDQNFIKELLKLRQMPWKVHSANEYETRSVLVEPFLACMGYDAKDINQVRQEYDIGGKRADYVIFTDRKPEIVVECKRFGDNISKMEHIRQLARYFDNLDKVKIGILTNGSNYHFYSRHRGKQGKMCNKPFFYFDIKDVDAVEVAVLKSFCAPLRLNEVMSVCQEIRICMQWYPWKYDSWVEMVKTILKNEYMENCFHLYKINDVLKILHKYRNARPTFDFRTHYLNADRVEMILLALAR